MNKRLKEDINNNKFKIIIIIISVIIYLLFMQIVFETWCPIKAIFHIECPGCGLTHATIYLLKGEFINAFNTNYTVFLWWGILILFFVDRYIHKFKKNIFPFFLALVCIITILRYFFNLLFYCYLN